jgi:hypothetical protein
MNLPKYRDSYLAKNSTAYELYTQWKKSGDNKDRAKLDHHMKVLDNQATELMKRYPSA